MAGIDKTYTNSFVEYKEFKEWANQQILTFFDGYKICIGDFVYNWSEEDFSDIKLPIMNTPTWLDIYLIQNCKIDFVLDRMKEVYDEESYHKFLTIDLTSKPPKDYQKNRNIKIKRDKGTKFPLHFKPYKGGNWWIQCENVEFNYNELTKKWMNYDSYYPTNTGTSHARSLKSVVRHLRKQYLPKGIVFRLLGNYIGENYLITIS